MANAITIPVKDTNVTKGTGFGEYFNNESFSDVKISVGNREFQAHKIILSAKSEVFKTMLSMLECKEFALLLDSGALVVKSEMVVVEAIQKWLRACGRLMYEEVEKDFVTLFNCVRIPMLSPVELHAVEKMSEFKDPDSSDLTKLAFGLQIPYCNIRLDKI
ncbi:hypothetical protein FSP39_000596 [Pinctada imbricata]|uniref:BTB domain-containing protein n=1 Tax=Pinctada imbricata TaxID=66713 RepID=A0AA88Y8K5_PINIB|nr:hypothetical protein FSP39_000596 [Pinctada imbricata]